MPYDQTDTDYPATEDAAENPNPESESDGKDEGATALLPKTVLGGKDFQPGEEVVLEVVHVYEDEVEVKYASEKPKSKSTMDESMGKMDEMMGGESDGGGGY